MKTSVLCEGVTLRQRRRNSLPRCVAGDGALRLPTSLTEKHVEALARPAGINTAPLVLNSQSFLLSDANILEIQDLLDRLDMGTVRIVVDHDLAHFILPFLNKI